MTSFCYHFFMTIDELVSTIATLKPRRSVKIIGVSGFCGSGKSTLAEELRKRAVGSAVVSIDDFIVGPRQERSGDWHTFDRERLKREVLDVVESNEPVTYMQYQSGVYANGWLGTSRTICPKDCLIIEGCGILHPSLMSYFDFSIWINCPLEIAIAQAKKRDRAQGNNDSELWDEIWGPNDADYYTRYRPDSLASVIFDWAK